LDLRRKRQQMSAFLLRQGLHYSENRHTWTKAHMSWLASQKLAHAEQRLVFEEMMLAMRQAQERIERLEQAVRAAVPDWSLAEAVTALMAMRGMDLVSATTFLAEIGDLSRFQTPRELMAYLGLVPSEQSTGDKIIRGPITRPAMAGTTHAGWSARGAISIRRGGQGQAGEGGGRAACGSRDRLEGAVPPQQALPSAGQERQAQDRRHHRGRARVRGFHLGGRARGKRGLC